MLKDRLDEAEAIKVQDVPDALSQAEDWTTVPHVARELMLIKVSCTAQQRGELVSLASMYGGLVHEVTSKTVILEVTGTEDKLVALKQVLEPYGILEVARSRVRISRDLGLDSK